MDIVGDDVARVALEQFDRLPSKRKPQRRKQGVQEWVPLSAIVAQGPHGLTCIALGTGMKCLPQSKVIQAQGNVLHDWHAEIVAIRACNRYLLQECLRLASSPRETSEFVQKRTAHEVTTLDFQPFTVHDNVTFHMYCSEAPCGDASMELIIDAQEDATPWETTNLVREPATDNSVNLLNGRGYFSHLGVVRRKPSRPDAPPTLSKSCSDKMAMRQCTSFLSSCASMIVSPQKAYIQTVTLPESQYSKVSCSRAFSASGRMASLDSKLWRGGYAFVPYTIMTTKIEFRYSRRILTDTGCEMVASNLATVWTPDEEESLIGGVLQGRRMFDLRGASMISRRKTWQTVKQVSDVLEDNCKALQCSSAGKYQDVKDSSCLSERRIVKHDVRLVLRDWTRNVGDENFSL